VTTGSGQRQLTVPGASLCYEVAGSGPVLLMIPEGTADADDFAPIVGFLADRFTVVRYDPRGISRSRLDGPAANVPVEVHADDADRLLMTTGAESDYVFGSSGGGMIGLALVARHPERVQTLVAHEPPVVGLLPEGSPRRAAAREVYNAYRQNGVDAAFETFVAVTGQGQAEPESEPPPELQATTDDRIARMEQNVEFFLAHYLLPITNSVPDVAALRAASSRIVVGVGENADGKLAHETTLALADRLGTRPVTFPGGHRGFFAHPKEFATKLDEVLRTN
jgi:pimeloyl-ACP methyl ester carboxylesterase